MVLNEFRCTHTLNKEDEFDLYRSSIATKVPEISVIFSSCNHSRREGDCESSLKLAVDSILKQSFTNFELILIDEYSSDDTKEFCQEVVSRDPRVQFYRFKKHTLSSAQRYNFGISVSRGKYVAFMFNDHRWEPNALEELYQGIEKCNRHCGIVYGVAERYYGSDKEHLELVGGKWGWNKIHTSNFISPSSVIVRREAIDLVGGYDEDPGFSENCYWDLWWRIGRKFQVGRITSKISRIYSGSNVSVKTLDLEVCRNRQRDVRLLPLRVTQEEPLYSQIQSICFDLYVSICEKVQVVLRRLEDKLKLKERSLQRE